MSDIPNPWDAQISSHALVLGFAYSLTPKGLPGQYNEKIAKQLNRIIRQARGLERTNDLGSECSGRFSTQSNVNGKGS
jgi:hypothetical protein